MKKLAILLVALVAVFSVAKAEDDRPIDVNQLPAAAQSFVKKYFGNKQVSLAKEDKGLFHSSYDVIFADGTKIEFDNKGNWEEVRSKNMPSGIIPKQVLNKVRSTYKGTSITKIERRDNGGYEVKLSNGLDLEFNKQLQLIDIDD